MATTFGRLLCCSIIEAHFGDVVGRVVKCLVDHGPLALRDIARYSEVGSDAVTSSVLVLVQHGCVQAFRTDHEVPRRVVTYYVAICDHILHRMRFPKFLVVLREGLGEEAELLVEGLLEHGRLTLEQITQRAAAKAGKGEGEVADEVKEVFTKLVTAQFIERCPDPEPWLHSKEPPQKVARGAPRVRGPVQEMGQAEVVQQVIKAAAPLETQRFQLPVSVSGLDVRQVSETTSVPQKRKLEALEMDSKTAAAVDEKEVLWRANFEEFLRTFRHQTCVDMVRTRLGTAASVVVSAMLQGTRKEEKSVREHRSVPISVDAIAQGVRATPDGQHMPLVRIRGLVQELASDGVGYLSRAGERAGPALGGNSYSVNMHNIIEARQKNEVEGIVLQRFGRECCRIFRLLGMKGQLEQKQIGEKAMVPKNVKALLYRLLKEQYVQVQEIARTSEHLARQSIFLWKVDYRVVLHKVLDDLYHAATNLCLRHAHETRKEHEVLGLVDQVDGGSDAHVTLTNVQQEQVKRVSRLTQVLDVSLLKLDDAILLFHDF